MGIDLQSALSVQILQSDLIFIYFDQSINFIHHMVKSFLPAVLPHLRITINRNFTASLVHLFHISGKLLNLSGKQSENVIPSTMMITTQQLTVGSQLIVTFETEASITAEVCKNNRSTFVSCPLLLT